MNRLIAVLLIFIVMLQCSIKTAIISYYQLNKDYIASNLCENRTKPESCCKGKCYLDKKLKAQQKEENRIPFSIRSMEELCLFFQNDGISFECSYKEIGPKFYSLYFLKEYSAPFFDIIQPPA